MAVVKIYPKVEELTNFNTNIACPEEGCTKIFTSESNLTLHRVKTHHRLELWQSKKAFYCPDVDCLYHEFSSFKTIKPLRQHYMKKHAAKKFVCEKCEQSFITVGLLNLHKKYCGVQFNCMDCYATYPMYESLQTHSKRKNHKIKNKEGYIVAPKMPIEQSKYRLILPRETQNKIVLNQASQTELLKADTKNRNLQIQSSKETQTKETATCTKEVESCKHSLDEGIELQKRKSIKVQTNVVESKTSSCNTSFDLNDFQLSEIEMLSSSTQTTELADYSASALTQESINTDTSDLLLYENFDPPFFNCMETQTDLLDNNDLFNYCDYYSNNMYTQTCDDIFGSSVFIDNETQTKINEMFNSVESQTIVSQVRMEDRDKATTETQTETELYEKLEEIHS